MDILLHSFIGGFYYSWQNVKSDFILFIPLSGVTHESGPINKSFAYRPLPPPYPSSVAPHSASTAAAATPLLCHPMSDAAARWGFNLLRRMRYIACTNSLFYHPAPCFSGCGYVQLQQLSLPLAHPKEFYTSLKSSFLNCGWSRSASE